MKFTEKHPRSIAKVISWRVLLTLSHTINGLIVTGSLLIGLKIAGLALVINSILYWIHERVWNFLQWNRKENDKLNFSEGNPRSVSKMISWRVLITITNFVIPFILTGSWGQAAIFTGLATVVNMGLYWGHERIWNVIRWGKRIKVETEIPAQIN
jgi:uncharacterized membrane protein